MLAALRDSDLLYYFKKLLNITFIISLATLIFLSFYKPPLPNQDEIVDKIKNGEPVQTELPEVQKEVEIIKKLGKYEYRLKPLYKYELGGLVVADYSSDNWLDVRHENDPGNIKDICVVWGENIKNGSYRQVKYKSGEFICFYRWNRKLENPFLASNLSNNHLVPENKDIGKNIRDSKIGDQVRVKGLLVDYRVYRDGKLVFTRKTSTKREDVRNGACEIIYVTDFEIIKEDIINFRQIRKIAGYSSLFSGILGILIFFLI